jgi:hypothetical protein
VLPQSGVKHIKRMSTTTSKPPRLNYLLFHIIAATPNTRLIKNH